MNLLCVPSSSQMQPIKKDVCRKNWFRWR
jgi:hypothetical protein